MERNFESDAARDRNQETDPSLSVDNQSNKNEIELIDNLDSGYSSLCSTIELTTSRESQAPYQYQSQTPVKVIQGTPSSKSTKSFSARTLFFGPKQPELILFPNAWVPEEFYRRFLDLVQLYDRPLKSKLKPKFMAWKVKVLGEDEASKRPFIVILCDSNSTKPIRKFFGRKEVRQQCEETDNLPSLPVLVVASSPTKVAADWPTVFGREEIYLSEDTSCGKSIKIVHDGRAKMATLGGIIKVVVNGKVAFCGMTAGHIIDEVTNTEESEDNESEDDFFNFSDDSEIEDDDFDERSSSKLSRASADSVPALEIHVPTETEGCNYGWKKVGQFSQLPVGNNDVTNRNLDWSLIEMTGFRWRKMNQVKEDTLKGNRSSLTIDTFYSSRKEESRTQSSSPTTTGPSDVHNRSVLYQPGTEPGYLKGKISLRPSFMMQYPSQKLVKVYNMTWDSDWDEVVPGDCGSWVIDRSTHELYGHIVAIDIFEEAYVVPFEDTVTQMAESLGADFVGLPTMMDFRLHNDICLEYLRSPVPKLSKQVEEPDSWSSSSATIKGSDTLVESTDTAAELPEEHPSKYSRHSTTDPRYGPGGKQEGPTKVIQPDTLDLGIYLPQSFPSKVVDQQQSRTPTERLITLVKSLAKHQMDMTITIEGLMEARERLAEVKKQRIEARMERDLLLAKKEDLEIRLTLLQKRAQLLKYYFVEKARYDREIKSIAKPRKADQDFERLKLESSLDALRLELQSRLETYLQPVLQTQEETQESDLSELKSSLKSETLEQKLLLEIVLQTQQAIQKYRQAQQRFDLEAELDEMRKEEAEQESKRHGFEQYELEIQLAQQKSKLHEVNTQRALRESKWRELRTKLEAERRELQKQKAIQEFWPSTKQALVQGVWPTRKQSSAQDFMPGPNPLD
ncbi:hypothetical protein TWF694_002009 [Orbilia ellipsospora]|uniref:Uncharacterized protein n=1 Tax=Orbilia ellipsospora TaxID=2528407 RepID=A0AAV9XAG7_9PEZI